MSNEEFIVIDTEKNTAPTKVTYNPLPVFTEGHPFLKEPTREVGDAEIKTPEFQQAIGQLKATMRTYNAVGLSANQCGLNLNMFVLGTDVFQMACINPSILESEGELVKKREGCVSFPALFLTVPRYERIRVNYQNENGESIDTWLDGVTAQCFQHELDHLAGLCYTDRVGPLAVKMAKQRQVKLIRKIKRSMK